MTFNSEVLWRDWTDYSHCTQQSINFLVFSLSCSVRNDSRQKSFSYFARAWLEFNNRVLIRKYKRLPKNGANLIKRKMCFV